MDASLYFRSPLPIVAQPYFGQLPLLQHCYGDPLPFSPQTYRQHSFPAPHWQQARGYAADFPPFSYHAQPAFQPFAPSPSRPFASLVPAPSGDPFMTEWMERVRSAKPESRPPSPRLKIPEARLKLSRAAGLVQSLRSLHAQLSSIPASDNVRRNLTMEEVSQAKRELQEIRVTFESEGVMDAIVKKLQFSRARRARKRASLGRRREEEHQRQTQAEQGASHWLEEKRSQELRKKTEAAVQKSAGGVLGEVRKKSSDIQQNVRLVAVLRELRDLRRDASRKKGDGPHVEEDERFAATCASLHTILTSQASVYESEEHALRVLMKEEVMEKMERSRKQANEAPAPVVEDEPIQSSAPAPDRPLSLSEYYLQAEQSIDALVAIRSEWDKFLSPHGHPVPVGGVCPSLPSSVMWEQYLQGSVPDI